MDMTVFDFGKTLASEMKASLPGDYVGCKNLGTYGVLAKMVKRAGKGDYLEIGTWRGASAVVAAKVKEEYGIGGRIVCIDHFRGYKNLPSVKHEAESTMKKYEVDDMIDIYERASRPLPAELKERRFRCAFIDGDHWGDNPYLDFLEIKDLVTDYIMFDDWDEAHPSVMVAVEKAGNTPGWHICHSGENCAIVERTNNA